MQIDILTLFPKMFDGPLSESIMWRAKDKKFVEINIHNLRDWAADARKTVDDRPYGGGAGMLLRVDILDEAIQSLKKSVGGSSRKVILLDAGGEKFSQKKAYGLSKADHLIFVCGHYEGVDHRVHEHLVDETISIGDYVLTGGEIPAMVIVDAVTRLIPGVIKEASLKEESHSAENFKEYPQYTRPEDYKGWKVPKVLLSGNHAEIDKWRMGE
jgi:tRNA (guanine37-N1)-methyltransferase